MSKTFKFQQRPKKVSTGVYLQQEVYDKVKQIAEQEGLSFNSILVQVIELGLDTLDKEDRNNAECA